MYMFCTGSHPRPRSLRLKNHSILLWETIKTLPTSRSSGNCTAWGTTSTWICLPPSSCERCPSSSKTLWWWLPTSHRQTSAETRTKASPGRPCLRGRSPSTTRSVAINNKPHRAAAQSLAQGGRRVDGATLFLRGGLSLPLSLFFGKSISPSPRRVN